MGISERTRGRYRCDVDCAKARTFIKTVLFSCLLDNVQWLPQRRVSQWMDTLNPGEPVRDFIHHCANKDSRINPIHPELSRVSADSSGIIVIASLVQITRPLIMVNTLL